MAAAVPASAAVTIGTQIVDTRLSGTIGGAPVASDGSDAAAGSGTISAAAQLVKRPAGGFPMVSGVSTVVAELTGGERGRVTFRRTLTPGMAASVQASAANYRYFFTTDAPGAFDVNWGLSSYGSGVGGATPGQALSLAVRGSGDTLLALDLPGDGASGSRSAALAAGSYELRIFDMVAPIAPAGTTSGLSSQYSFTIRSVPEPATWGLLLTGLAATGMALRRRRASVAA